MGIGSRRCGIYRGLVQFPGQCRAFGAQGSCRYFIDVDLLGLSQPTFGFTFEVTSHANYKVYDAGGKSALLATISGAYTADFAEAPVGSMRLKRANEGAIRASITQFLDRLRTMK